MATEEHLDELWESLQRELSDRFFAVFPSVPQERAALGVEQHTGARWPDDRSLKDFLDLALALGVRVIYAQAQTFGPQELSGLQSQLPSVIPGAEEFIESAEATYGGRVLRVRLMWAVDGIAHHATREAEWYQRLLEEAEHIRDAGSAIVIAEYTADTYELARNLAENPEFQRLGTLKERKNAVTRLSPAFLKAYRARQYRYADQEHIAREAWRIYQEELVPEKERQLAEEARRLMADGLSRVEAAGHLDVTPDRLRRILARYRE